MHRRTLIIGLVVGALSSIATTAVAASVTPDIFGVKGASKPVLAPNCARIRYDLAPAGKTVTELKKFTNDGFSILGNQVDCGIVRQSRAIACSQLPIPVVTHRNCKGKLVTRKSAILYIEDYRSCMSGVTGTGY